MAVVALLAGCSGEPSPTGTTVPAPGTAAAPATEPTIAAAGEETTTVPQTEGAPTTTTATPTEDASAVPTTVPAAVAEPESALDHPVPAKRGFSDDHGVLSEYVKPAEIDGTGRKLLAIYMVGSDLEEDGLASSLDLEELVLGYDALANWEDVEVVVAFGGADKDGWRGMKIADVSS